VTITGTRSIDMTAESRLTGLFDDYLRPFADPDARFHLGGAAGIDTAVLDWLAEHTKVILIVVVPCTVADHVSPKSSSWEQANSAHPPITPATGWMVDRRDPSTTRDRTPAWLSALRLGKPGRAMIVLGGALSTPTASRRHKACVISDLATAQARMREPEAAADHLATVVRIVGRSHGFVSTKRLFRARKALIPWQGEPFVKELDEQIYHAGIA